MKKIIVFIVFVLGTLFLHSSPNFCLKSKLDFKQITAIVKNRKTTIVGSSHKKLKFSDENLYEDNNENDEVSFIKKSLPIINVYCSSTDFYIYKFVYKKYTTSIYPKIDFSRLPRFSYLTLNVFRI